MLFGFFLTFGVAVLSAGLRSFQNSYAQKAGALGILAATFLGVYFITGSWIWGFVGAMSWLFLPWLEILTRIRALRLPKEKRLRPKRHDFSFYYLRISSRAKGGTVWTTWNYPLSYGLKLTPLFRINRQRPDRSFWQLYQSHRDFLRRNGVNPAVIDPLDEEQIETEMENDLRDQIAHNIHKGVLKQTAAGDVKYSWRGMFYLWCQFLVDLVRL